MKGKLLFIVFFLLMTCTISSAQIRLDRKSVILPARTNSKIAFPQFALNTKTGDTLIAWVDWEDSPDGKDAIVGRIVNAKGNIVGKAFTIMTLVRNPSDFGLSLAYNPIMNEFLLVYNDGGRQAQIFVLRLTADGRRNGKAIDITSGDPSTAPYSNGDTTLKFNPKTGGYTLLFLKTGGLGVPNDSAYYYALLTGKGELSGPLQKIEEGFPGNLFTYFIDFAYLPSADKLLMLAWLREDHDVLTLEFVDYGLAAVDPSKLKNLKRPDFEKIGRVLNPDPNQSKLALLRFLGESFAFTSADSPIIFYTDNQNVKGRGIDANGKLSSRVFSAFKPPLNETQLFWPSAAFSETSRGVRGILIAVEDEGTDGAGSIWAQVLDKNGKPSGSPVKLYTTADNEKIIDGGAIIALPVKPGDTVTRFVWYGFLQRTEDFDPSRTYFGLGNQILKLNISLTTP